MGSKMVEESGDVFRTYLVCNLSLGIDTVASVRCHVN